MRSSIEGLIFICSKYGPQKDERWTNEMVPISALIKSSCNRNGAHDFSSDESILDKQTAQIL